MDDFITTARAAEIIGCVDSRVRQLLRKGQLAGKRIGRDWFVSRADAERYRDADRRPGPKPEPTPAPKRRRKKKGQQP